MQTLAKDDSPDMSAPRATLLKCLDAVASKDWLAVPESNLNSDARVGHSNMTTTATLNATEIRPLLQNKIGQMSDDQVTKLHRVMQKLEAQQLWDEIKAEGARDRVEGKFDRITEVIAEVRAEMAASRA